MSAAIVSPRAARKQQTYDRYIPNRDAMDFDASADALLADADGAGGAGRPASAGGDARILAFRAKAPAAPAPAALAVGGRATAPAPAAAPRRPLPQNPSRVLDAPGLVDDFYCNLLAWGGGASGNTSRASSGANNGLLAVALGPAVYLWDSASGTVSALGGGADTPGGRDPAPEGDYVSSVSWAADGVHLAVGVAGRAEVQIWDAAAGRQLRSLRGHGARVGASAWNGACLATGSRDSVVLTHDVRVRSHITGTLRGHTQEVCGLAWDAPGRLLASGGNDNAVNVWEPQGRGGAAAASVGAAGGAGGATALPGASPALRWRFEAHTAAVKALAWCPFNPAVLATGGGSADGSIRLWNGHTGAALASVATGAQVCALAWSRTERELVSSHGGPDPRLSVWRGSGLARVGDVRGHAGRALHLALSPDGRTLASAGADETLRFWPLFEPDAHAACRGGATASVKAGGVGAKAGMAGRPVTVR